jgi:hypothetical protein
MKTMASKVKYKIDLRSLMDRAFDNREKRDKLRSFLTNESFKRAFGFNIIDKIVERTQNKNIDKNNKNFKAYSKSYIKSDVFDIYGKSRSDINMTLTGDMLSSMDVESVSATAINIYFPDKENNDKAHGHINGIKTKTGKVVRDFFGLPEDEELKVFAKTINDASREASIFEVASTMAGM